MSGLRRRPAAQDADELQEPLLQSDEPEDAPKSRSRSTAGPLVPHSINRIDWEQLLRSVLTTCQHGWQAVRETICKVLGFQCHSQHEQPSALQVDRLEELQQRIQTPYDPSSSRHQDALKELWSHAFPDTPFAGFKNQKWTDMGWQRDDPASDFRGAGFVALQNMLHMAREKPALFKTLLHKTQGSRSEWEYPFAVAGVNLTFMLEEIVGLRDNRTAATLSEPATSRTAAGRGFLQLLADSAVAFEELYCMAFELLDQEWLSMHASYMDFPSVIARVRRQCENALTNSPASLLGLKQLLVP